MGTPKTQRDKPAGLLTRGFGALRRRLRSAWRRLSGQTAGPPVAAVLERLLETLAEGLTPTVGADWADPLGVAGASVDTLLNLGCRDEACGLARRLASLQRIDGAIPDACVIGPSLFNTAQAARGLLAILDDLPEVELAARRACRFLTRRIDGRGRLLPSESGMPLDRIGQPGTFQLACLEPLAEGARRWCNDDWAEIVDRSLAYYQQNDDPTRWETSPLELAWWADTLVTLERREAANAVLDRLGARQAPDGTALAHLAALWYRLGRCKPADRVMRRAERALARKPHAHSPPGSVTFVQPETRSDAWVDKHYLDAARWRVRAACEATWQELPDHMDPADCRVQAVREWAGALPHDATVAHVGCGKGPFLEHLRERFPQAGPIGIDVVPQMLAQLPPGVTPLQGSPLRVPVPDGAFDGAFAVESLGHSLLPERAVSEMCRIVHPGGWVLIVEKNRPRHRLEQRDPRAVSPEELTAWLGRFCDEVTVHPIAHREGQSRRDRFLAATARRRPS